MRRNLKSMIFFISSHRKTFISRKHSNQVSVSLTISKAFSGRHLTAVTKLLVVSKQSTTRLVLVGVSHLLTSTERMIGRKWSDQRWNLRTPTYWCSKIGLRRFCSAKRNASCQGRHQSCSLGWGCWRTRAAVGPSARSASHYAPNGTAPSEAACSSLPRHPYVRSVWSRPSRHVYLWQDRRPPSAITASSGKWKLRPNRCSWRNPGCCCHLCGGHQVGVGSSKPFREIDDQVST